MSSEAEHVARETAERSLDDLRAEPGIAEAIELYEAAMLNYSIAATYEPPVPRISSSSSTSAIS